MMGADDCVTRWSEFFNLENIRPDVEGKKVVCIKFLDISGFDPMLAEELLKNPEECIRAAELSIEERGEIEKVRVRFLDLPKVQNVKIREVRVSTHKKFVSVCGVIKQKSPVRPSVVSIRFECPSCGVVIPLLQLEETVREPTKCGCGRKGKFKELTRESIDVQGLVLEESPDDALDGDKYQRINVILKEDLTNPSESRKYIPGNKVTINGFINEVKKRDRVGKVRIQSEIILTANSVEPIESLFEELKINKEDEERIKQVSRRGDVFELLTDAFAPTIHGHTEAKKGIVLQMFGGVKLFAPDGTTRRGSIHILMPGDPGAAKSILLKRVADIHPKSRYVTAASASAIGLTASVVKDEFLGGFTGEAGAMVLSNKGVCCIDEIGQISKEEEPKLHEAMEQQTISLDKANVHETFPAETSVLAAGNPEHGRFDPYTDAAHQIGMGAPLQSRFDLQFIIKDVPEESRDRKIAKTILSLKRKTFSYSVVDNPFHELAFFRKYVAFAITNYSPELSEEAAEVIEDFYVNLRKGDRIKNVTARQLEGLIRLSEAHSKIRLSHTVSVQDARVAIGLAEYCWRQMGMESESGTIDLDKVNTGFTNSQRNRLRSVLELISKDELCDVGDILKEAGAKGIGEQEVEDIIEKLKRGGQIFEPKNGFVRQIQ